MEEQENVISPSLDIKLIATKTFQLSVCVAIAVVAPYFLNQLITGSIVNALLFISASVFGLETAFLLCLIPSLISLYTGLLPLAIAPMIPFIMTGNALLVLIFYKLNFLLYIINIFSLDTKNYKKKIIYFSHSILLILLFEFLFIFFLHFYIK